MQKWVHLASLLSAVANETRDLPRQLGPNLSEICAHEPHYAKIGRILRHGLCATGARGGSFYRSVDPPGSSVRSFYLNTWRSWPSWSLFTRLPPVWPGTGTGILEASPVFPSLPWHLLGWSAVPLVLESAKFRCQTMAAGNLNPDGSKTSGRIFRCGQIAKRTRPTVRRLRSVVRQKAIWKWGAARNGLFIRSGFSTATFCRRHARSRC